MKFMEGDFSPRAFFLQNVPSFMGRSRRYLIDLHGFMGPRVFASKHARYQFSYSAGIARVLITQTTLVWHL